MITCLKCGGIPEKMAFWSGIFYWQPGGQEAGIFAFKKTSRGAKKASFLAPF
jgi:hypothetical protein